MRARLLKWLVCPRCHRDLRLVIAQSERAALTIEDYETLEKTEGIADSDEVEVEITGGALSCDEKYCYLEMLRDEELPPSIPSTYRQNVGIRGFRQQISVA